MYTLSTRTLSALAYERGEEYDPSLPPVTPSEIEALALLETARPVDRRARRLRAPPSGAQRERQRAKRELNGILDWFSAQDLIAAPWETAEQRFV